MIKMKLFTAMLFLGLVSPCVAQEVVVSGNVFNTRTKTPLVSAAVRLKNNALGTYTDNNGRFGLRLPDTVQEDTLIISYLGYTTTTTYINRTNLVDSNYPLQESPTILDEVTVLSKSPEKFEIRKLEASMRHIKGNLYASN